MGEATEVKFYHMWCMHEDVVSLRPGHLNICEIRQSNSNEVAPGSLH